MKKEEIEDIMINQLLHFHPDAMNYGGWNIRISKYEAPIIRRHFKRTLKIIKDKDGDLVVKPISKKFTPKQTALLYKYERDIYKEEADKLYYAIKALNDSI